MQPQDVKTLESYKKAMRAAASHIKDNTKFCIYTDVQLPDAGGKMHTVRPFLVIGSGQSVVKPLLALLKGGKKLLCEGTCALQEGKIALNGRKVPYGQLKAQATFFKDLLGGKQVAIPAGHKDEDDEGDREEILAAQAHPAPALKPAPPSATTASPIPPAANLASSMGGQPPLPAPPNQAPPAKTAASPAPQAPSAAEPHPVRLAKASDAWHGTRGVVDGKCKELKQAIRAHYGSTHPEVLREIENNMHKIDGIVGKLDHTLADSLKKASSAPTEAARMAELRVARTILNQYITYVKGEPLLGLMDSNPFGVKCNLRQVLAASLTHMSQSITA